MRRPALLFVVLAACGRTVIYEPRTAVADAGTVKSCHTGGVALSHATPALYFVIDRSGSMAFDLKGNTGGARDPLQGPSRWTILWDVMRGVLPQHDLDLSIGAALFPSSSGCGFPSKPNVIPHLANSAAVLALSLLPPGGGTPVAGMMESMREPAREASAKSLVLITDGEPNCNASLEPQTCHCTQPTVGVPPLCPSADICLDDQRTVTTLGNLFDGGVVTHVVGFAAGDAAAATLDAMAIAGGAPRTGPHRFNSAETEAELSDVLTGISERERNCTWTVLTHLEAGDALELTLGIEVVPEGTGWEWLKRDEGSFVLRDTWCDRTVAGAQLVAHLTCR
jgi:hypothetical protein